MAEVKPHLRPAVKGPRSQCGIVNPYSSCKYATKASFEVAPCCKHVQLHRLCAAVVVASIRGGEKVCGLDTGVGRGDHGPRTILVGCANNAGFATTKLGSRTRIEVAR